MNEYTALSLSLILLVGVACQWIAWRVKLPAIIFLLACGALAGPVLDLLDPDVLLGDLLFPFVSLSVAIILFEGSMTLRFRDIPGLERVIRRMITLGVLISWAITAVATRLIMDFSWHVALLFGAFMVVTGPTVIKPLLRSVRPKTSVANVLQWESILIDAIGATLAVLVYQFIVSGGLGHGGVIAGLLVFGEILLIGVLLGAGSGYLLGILLRRHWIPKYLHNVAALSLVCCMFALSDLFQEESGLLTVTVMGVWLANMKGVELDEIFDFKESLSILLLSMLFILLVARMDMHEFLSIGWPALGVLAVIQFLVRPLSVQVCALGSKLSMSERHLLAWIAPRGIVAAAISALFAIKLEALGYHEAPQMVPLTFMIIIGTVLLQSMTAGPIAKWLRVSEPEANGFLIYGANPVARAIAEALVKNGFKVQLADQNWTNVKEAKLMGLPVYWGNPVSEHAERHLDLVGIGNLLALTPHNELNALAAHYYRMEFEPRNIFTVRTHCPERAIAEEKCSYKFGGRQFPNTNVSFIELEDMLGKGAAIKTTTLTEEFTWDNYRSQQGERRVPLLAVTPARGVMVFNADAQFTPRPGWKIVGLDRPAAS